MSRLKFELDPGFNDTHVDQVQNAHIRARKMAERVRSEVEEIWDQRRGPGRWKRRRRAWRRNASFVRWFGDDALTRNQMRLTRKRIIEVEKRFGKRVTYVLKGAGGQCKPGRWAWHAGGLQARRIRLCPPFFFNGSPSSDQIDRQASVLIHEMAHGFGQVQIVPGVPAHLIPGTGHPQGADSRAEALTLARDHPRKARRSPENYEGLYRAYGGK
jgi:hypothetical protein